MSEFKFSCPNCKQSMQATPEYVGVQITCPSCHASIVVPEAPGSAPAHGAPKAGKLSKAPSTVQHAATSPVMAAATVRQNKKPRYGLYIGLAVGAAVIAAGIFFGPPLYDKYNEHKAAVAAAQEAITNPPPPPPPPELEADEILKKVGETYKAFPTYSVQAMLEGTIDKSQISPMFKTPLEVSSKVSLRLGRPEYFHMEWEEGEGARLVKGAAWSAGKGDLIHLGKTTTKLKDLETALASAGSASGSLVVWTAALFFDQTNSLTAVFKNYAKTNSETIGGQNCYVLTGKISYQNAMVWIHKSDFLIAKAELFLGGTLTDSMTASLTPVQKNQMEKAAKMRGDYIETYSGIDTTKKFSPADFEASFPPNPTAPSNQPKPARKKRP
jgi:hypothetical protein